MMNGCLHLSLKGSRLIHNDISFPISLNDAIKWSRWLSYQSRGSLKLSFIKQKVKYSRENGTNKGPL